MDLLEDKPVELSLSDEGCRYRQWFVHRSSREVVLNLEIKAQQAANDDKIKIALT